jgi:hypothetical protein
MSWPSYVPSFTPITNMGVSSLDGADNTTFFAPPFMCLRAVSSVRNCPVLSTMYSAPESPHLMFAGSISLVIAIFLPPTITKPSPASTS